MPKGKRGSRGRRTARNGGQVQVSYRASVLIGGPASMEDEIRAELLERLGGSLHRCPMFSASGMADRYADEIAASVPYVVREGVEPIVRLDSVDVLYRNPPNHWKWWSRIRDGEDTIEPGEWA